MDRLTDHDTMIPIFFTSLMIRITTLTGLVLALLSLATPASAYFAEDFALPVAPIIRSADTPITVTPVILPEADTSISRAQFTALVVEKLYAPTTIDHCYWDIGFPLPPQFSLVFSDVSVNDPYAKHLCIAMRDGLIRGYGDGTFRPEQPITVAESSRILSRAYGLTPYADATHYDLWYEPYVWALAERNALPLQIKNLSQSVSVSIAQEMQMRVHEHVTDKPKRTYRELMVPPATPHPPMMAPIDPTPSITDENNDPRPDEVKQSESETPASQRNFWDLF